MKKLAILKSLAGVVLAGPFALSMPVTAASPVEECSKELLLSYFPETFVRETLKKYNVPQAKWDAIVKELNQRDKEVVKTVEEKASKINPNPLKDPQQRQAAVKIFRETLTDIFTGVMKKNGVTDDNQIQQMLDDVQQQKAKRFAQCLEQQKSQPTQTNQAVKPAQPQAAANQQAPVTQPKTAAPTSSNTTDNNDDDSDDDSDDEDDL